MGQILSLRHYRHDVIAHSHEHAQVVISLSGTLDFLAALIQTPL